MDDIQDLAPKGEKQAFEGPHRHQWIPAMQREYDAHMKNGTWTVVCETEYEEAVKKGKQVYMIPYVWKYRIKTENGVITRFKARLCANGMFMKCDPKDTFAPTARASSIKVMCALAASFDCVLHAGDIPAAYIKADIDPKMEIYMPQPRGFEIEGKENHIVRLNKALYGIPPAGKLWNKELHKYLQAIGMQQSKAEPCLYYIWKDNDVMVISLSTDDFLHFYTSEELKDRIIKKLKEKFDYEDKGPCTWFLGMGMVQTEDVIEIDQEDYVREIVEAYPHVIPRHTPAHERSTLEAKGEDEDDAECDYRSITGKLRYVTITRPDIEFALNRCCRFQSNPGKTHEEALMWIIGYLKKHPRVPLRYEKNKAKVNPRDHLFKFTGLGDASLGNGQKRRSLYGYVILG